MTTKTPKVYWTRKAVTMADALVEIFHGIDEAVLPAKAVPVWQAVQITEAQRSAFIPKLLGDHAFLQDALRACAGRVLCLQTPGHVDIWVDAQGYDYARYVGFAKSDIRSIRGE